MDRLKQLKIDGYRKKLSYMISDTDFLRYFPNIENKIIKYSELAKYKTIEDLLPNNEDFVIILIESHRNEGHWTTCCRKNDKYIWFDSYGLAVDAELNFISNKIKNILGEDKRFLSKLLKNHQYTYNKVKYQSEENGINTCGRWVILFIQSFHLGYDLNSFKRLMNEQQQKRFKIEGDVPFDIICVDFYSF